MGALAEMAKNCGISSVHDEWIRDTFINNMKKLEVKSKLLSDQKKLSHPPQKTLNVKLNNEKGSQVIRKRQSV